MLHFMTTICWGLQQSQCSHQLLPNNHNHKTKMMFTARGKPNIFGWHNFKQKLFCLADLRIGFYIVFPNGTPEKIARKLQTCTQHTNLAYIAAGMPELSQPGAQKIAQLGFEKFCLLII